MRAAVRYWASYSGEIDAEITAADAAEDSAERAWQRERQLPRPGEQIFTDDFAISCGGAVTSASAPARA